VAVGELVAYPCRVVKVDDDKTRDDRMARKDCTILCRKSIREQLVQLTLVSMFLE